MRAEQLDILPALESTRSHLQRRRPTMSIRGGHLVQEWISIFGIRGQHEHSTLNSARGSSVRATTTTPTVHYNFHRSNFGGSKVSIAWCWLPIRPCRGPLPKTRTWSGSSQEEDYHSRFNTSNLHLTSSQGRNNQTQAGKSISSFEFAGS